MNRAFRRLLFIEPAHAPAPPQDGFTLESYGIGDGSLVHPLYGWRDGRAGSDAVSRLLSAVPWQEPEWYAAAAGGGARAMVAASSALLPRLGAWYGPAAAPPPPREPARPPADAAAAQGEL